MTKAFEEVDIGFYVAFGSAICANIQALVLTPALLMKSWRRNGPAVLANLCFTISNWMNFYQLGMECSTAAYLVELFMILGSILEVLAPLTRAFPLLNSKVKKGILALCFVLVATEFTSMIQLNYGCDQEESQFVLLEINIPSEVFSHCLGIIVYFVAFSKIIKLVNDSIFAKDNGKMQLLKSISLFSMYAAIAIKCGTLLGYLLDREDTEVEMAMKSNLVMILMVSQLTLELANKAAEKPSTSQEQQFSGTGKDKKKSTTNIISTTDTESQKGNLRKPSTKEITIEEGK
eukprot:NODE_51_length_31136_cov_0.357670.p11 type:complete len:290 gc:universal NODE_51_length_31136_cov_0.357670:1335-2204(+)